MGGLEKSCPAAAAFVCGLRMHRKIQEILPVMGTLHYKLSWVKTVFLLFVCINFNL